MRTSTASVAFLLLAAAGCSGPSLLWPPPVVIRATVVLVTDTGFTPRADSVRAGRAVTWHWDGSHSHGVAFDSGGFASPVEQKRTGPVDWELTFSTRGTYSYHCPVHPTETGAIVVR